MGTLGAGAGCDNVLGADVDSGAVAGGAVAAGGAVGDETGCAVFVAVASAATVA